MARKGEMGIVECFSIANAYRFGDALAEHHRFRHRCFIERLGYRVPSYEGMEYDQYDTLTALYLNYRGSDGRVLGCCRLVPTTGPYMLAEQWPEIVTGMVLPRTPEVLEGTRLGVEERLPARERVVVFNTMLVAIMELAERNGVTGIIAVATPQVSKGYRRHLGEHMRLVGETTELPEGDVIHPIFFRISDESMRAVRGSTGVEGGVISVAEDFGGDRCSCIRCGPQLA